MKRKRHHQQQLALKIILCAKLFFLLCCLSSILTATATTTTVTSNLPPPSHPQLEHASNIMAKLIKSTQVSACDNEQLSIKCNEDYFIDVIAVEHTIITADNVKDTRVNNQSSSTTIRKLPNSLLSLSDSNVVVEQQEQAVCQQLPAPPPAALQLSSSSPSLSLSSPDGNGTSATININKNGTEPGVCDQNQAQALASSKDIAALVRNECRSRNTCTLDLRWPRAANNNNNNKTMDGVESATNGTTQRGGLSPTTNQALGLRANGFLLSKLFNEPCPGNRKLIEIVYKCRPMKLNKRTVCRNSQLHLECPNEKKLVLISGDYGAWANDTKNHEKCSIVDPSSLSSSSFSTQTTNRQAYLNDSVNNSSIIPGPLPVAQSAAQLNKNCLVNSSKTMSVLASNCLYRRSCDLPVTPAIFGDAQCPVGQAEYLKMVYICVNSTLLIDGSLIANLSIFSTRPTLTTISRVGGQQDAAAAAQPFYINSNVSSLLSSPITTTNIASQVSSQQQIADMSNDQQIPGSGGGGRYRSLGNTLPSSVGGSETHLNDMYDEPSNPPAPTQYETRKVTLIPVAGDPTKYSQMPPLAHYSQINAIQRLRDLFAKYQSPILIITLSMASTMLFVIMLLSCRLKSSNGSNSSSASKDSTCSTKSSTTGFKSYGSSSSSSHGGAQLHSASSNTKHNSCSESCFSLDDYNFNTGSNGNHSIDSPAPNSSINTPLDSNNNNMEASSNFGGAQSLVRPKLWTIYNNTEQVTNPLRMSSTQHHHTMRPTRSFVGQQQVSSQIHQLRTLHCMHQQNQNQPLQQQQQQVQQPSARDSLSSAHDLLLQTAPIPQQPTMQQQISSHQQAANWCATLNQQVQHHLESPPQQQIDSQAQILVGTTIPQLHHQINNTMAPPLPQQCAFHQSQNQNQQQLILQEQQQNIPLEYSQSGAATILASQQQQQQSQQQQQLQQQQQQAALDARQFHPNFQHHHT